MSDAAVAAPTRQAAAPEPGSKSELRLQRKCACGQHTLGGGECAACRKRRMMTQRWSADRPGPDALLRGGGGAAAATDAVHPAGSDLSGVRTQSPALRTAPRLQRAPEEDGASAGRDGGALEEPAESAQAPEAAGPAPAASVPPPESAAPGPAPGASEPEAAPGAAAAAERGAALLVDDDAGEVATGQMRKTEFLEQLERTVCAEADAALAAARRSTDGCPYLAQAFGHYRGQPAARVESGLRKYAPETRDARTAAETIPLLAARVRQGVQRWVATGEISGVPDDVPVSLPTGGLLGAIGGVASGIGSLLFKAREGGARAADDPAAVHAELGAGRAMESGVRGRMERAFGRGFGDVRMHTDATARRFSTEQNARAFTVGGHVAFAAGEYRPGTPAGDALIAHELAHTLQQGGRSAAAQAKSADGASYGALEADADRSAAGVVARLWGGAKEKAAAAVPALRSGLTLQRCTGKTPAPATPEAHSEGKPATATETPGTPPPATDTPGAATPAADDAAARAKAVDALVGDTECQPTGVTLAALAARDGASATNFGWTKPGTIARRISPRYDGSKHECFLASFVPAALTFDSMHYVDAGEHRYASQTRRDAACGDKELPLFVEVSADAAKLFKAGEVEHCQDIRRAFSLTWVPFNAAAAATVAEGRFPATDPTDCTGKIQSRIAARMGMTYDGVRTTFDCLVAKSRERDTNGWHSVDVNQTKAKRAPDCAKVVHVLDESKIVPEIGKHPTATLVKGCGEPTAPAAPTP